MLKHRQLAREREELEQVHKTRLERIREREEALMEQLVMKEKVVSTLQNVHWNSSPHFRVSSTHSMITLNMNG